jgi:hypothetical protein
MIVDPITFIENTLVDPETCAPFALTAAERVFLRHAFRLTPDGRLRTASSSSAARRNRARQRLLR